jgi:hypothetical protein
MLKTSRLAVGIATLLFLVFAACSERPKSPPAASDVEPARIDLAVAGRSSHAPAVAAWGQAVAVAWTASTESTSDIYVSVSADGGKSFGTPVRVNQIDGDARASGEQAARVVMDKTTIHVVGPSRQDGRSLIRYARSTDRGRSFSDAVSVAGGALSGLRGWHAVTLGYDGGVHVVWLDGRNAAPMRHQHHKSASKSMGEQAPRQDIFHASWDADNTNHAERRKGDADRADDAERKEGDADYADRKEGDADHADRKKNQGARSERPIAANVCFCCKTAVATSGDRVYAAWRHIYPGSVRDIAVARSTDNGLTFGEPARVSEDGWKIEACPDDGPAMAADGHGGIHIAWPTLVPGDTPRKGVFYAARSDDNTFTPRLRLDSGKADPAHPQIASDEHGTSAVVWDERADDARRIVLRRVSNGAADPPLTFDGTGVTYPVVAAGEGYWIVVWFAQGAEGRSVIEGRRIPFVTGH